MVQMIRGSYFQSRQLVYALRSGDRRLIARALAVEAMYVRASGSRQQQRAEKILQRAHELATSLNDEFALAWVKAARVAIVYPQYRGQRTTDACEQALPSLRAHGKDLAWELSTVRLYHVWSLFYAGEAKKMDRVLTQRLRDAHARDDRFSASQLSVSVANFSWLFADQPDAAHDALTEALRSWTPPEYQLLNCLALIARVNIDLYRGAPLAALRALDEEMPALKASLLMRIEPLRVSILEQRARAYVAAAAGTKRKAFLRAAAKDAKRLLREPRGWFHALAWYTRASVAHARGDTQQATSHFASAIRMCEELELPLHENAGRRRLGELMGGGEGDRLRAEATAWMLARGIVNPDRVTDTLVPLAK